VQILIRADRASAEKKSAQMFPGIPRSAFCDMLYIVDLTAGKEARSIRTDAF